jgi:TonB family protein
MRSLVGLILLISSVLCAQDVLNQGVAAFKHADYQRAVELFREETTLHPNNVNGHLYLATAYMSMWIPGLASPENEAIKRSAETEFKRVLELDPNDKTALASLASIEYGSASGLQGEEKFRKLDEALDWYKRLASVDPANKEAPYSIGVIAWAKWYPALMTMRAQSHMRPEDPGPLPSTARQQLKAQYSPIIEDGIANLDRALQLDPQYDDAMAYLNLLIRERADLRDTKEEYAADVDVADQWVRKALDTKKAKAQVKMAPPPPPPPEGGGEGSRAPMIRVQFVGLVSTVDPIYPAAAKRARISGTVRFTVTIAKDGKVQNLEFVSGHPMLVAAALEAVKQYVFKPTLLNGNPVEVITQVAVNFALDN